MTDGPAGHVPTLPLATSALDSASGGLTLRSG